MKQAMKLTSAVVFLMSAAQSAGAGDVTLKDLVPKYDYTVPSQPDFTKTAPKPAQTEYQRFDKWVKEQRATDGPGVNYSPEHKTPIITYKKSFD